MSSQRITNLATPIDASDAATRGYVDARGGGMGSREIQVHNRVTGVWTTVGTFARQGTMSGVRTDNDSPVLWDTEGNSWFISAQQVHRNHIPQLFEYNIQEPRLADGFKLIPGREWAREYCQICRSFHSAKSYTMSETTSRNVSDQTSGCFNTLSFRFENRWMSSVTCYVAKNGLRW